MENLQNLYDRFGRLWDAMDVDEDMFPGRRAATFRIWKDKPEHIKKAMEDYLLEHGAPKKKNPYFFVAEFKIKSSEPIGEPTDMNGRALKKGVQYITAKYNGRWGLYSKDDVELFGLEVKS